MWVYNEILLPGFLVNYPIYYATSLIQMGHEPISATSTTFFGRPMNSLPNVLQYVQHIASVDGFMGCYRGVNPVLHYFFLCRVVRERAQKMLSSKGETNDQRSDVQFRDLLRTIAARSAATLLCQPLNVVALRSMAQFVGHETNYKGVFDSLGEVFRESGPSGFFNGVVPLLIGGAAAAVLATLLSIAANHFVKDPNKQKYVSFGAEAVAHFLCLPFQTVANTMAVNNCGLAAGVPTYRNWICCWEHLWKTEQLTRGNWLFWRRSAVNNDFPWIYLPAMTAFS